MNRFMERWIVVGIVVISFLCAWRASAAPREQRVVIKKAFHHCASNATNLEQENCLEMGSCVLYGIGLTKDSVTEKLRHIDGIAEQTFIIADATSCDASCKQMISSINNRAGGAGYSIKIEDRKSPDEGLKLIFRYPADRCMITYKAIDSIQREKGLVFNIYNRQLVQTLKQQQNPVIRTASLDEPRVIFIDPGHGGSDTGAIACSGVSEKEVCLSIAHVLNDLLSDRGYTVHLSRDADSDVPLDIRTGLASACDAMLVVSIHANAAPKESAAGSEIFFLDPFFVDDQVHMQMPLYRVLKKKMSARITESRRLAVAIEHELQERLPTMHNGYHNRGVKTAVSQLLLGTFRPTVLIEIGFLTNPREAQLLADHRYQRLIAYSIASGIDHYCRNI